MSDAYSAKPLGVVSRPPIVSIGRVALPIHLILASAVTTECGTPAAASSCVLRGEAEARMRRSGANVRKGEANR